MPNWDKNNVCRDPKKYVWNIYFIVTKKMSVLKDGSKVWGGFYEGKIHSITLYFYKGMKSSLSQRKMWESEVVLVRSIEDQMYFICV